MGKKISKRYDPAFKARVALEAAKEQESLAQMKKIDRLYTRRPFYGSRKILFELRELGHDVNRKHVQRLMQVMGLQGLVPGPHTSKPHPDHPIYPYSVGGIDVVRPNQVWA